MTLDDTQETKLINSLDKLTGEQVRQLFTDFHGCQLLTKEFAEHCVEEGLVEAEDIGLETEDEEEETEEDECA